MADEAQILVTPLTITCACHGEHLRAQWPKGFAAVGLSLTQAALESESLHKTVRGLMSRRERKGKLDVRLINKVTATRPLCYFVDRDVIRQAFIDADILVKQRCDICGVVRLAGPYDMTHPIRGRVTDIVCIECALDAGEREHKFFPKGAPPRG